jgi:hypothetical protein
LVARSLREWQLRFLGQDRIAPFGKTYTVHPVNIFKGKQFDPAFLKVNPNPTDDQAFSEKTWRDLAARDLGSLSARRN